MKAIAFRGWSGLAAWDRQAVWLSIRFLCALAILLPSSPGFVGAHDWHPEPDALPSPSTPFTAEEQALINAELAALQEVAVASAAPNLADVSAVPTSVKLFADTFSNFRPKLRFRWDTSNFWVESDGIPDHNMMVGITAWQQQIPLPTFYFGANAWRLPLNPIPTNTPYLITTNTFTRGAIALAANGIPIFNPYNNRGEASALIGELDQWGGHCGRADDYHYHVAPLHLTNVLGVALPVAFALDGYPVYGLTEPDGSAVTGLDSLKGHTNGIGSYHYHASLSLPYLNAGFHGMVSYVGGQVDPQPSVQPVRPSGVPLTGASILGFTNPAPDQYSLRYRLTGKTTDYFWNYSLNRTTKTVSVTYVGVSGTTQTNYTKWEPAPALANPSIALSRADLGGLSVLLSGQAARGYLLQGSSDLKNWNVENYVLLNEGGSLSVPVEPSLPFHFYRVR